MDKMEKASEKKKGFVKEFMDFLQTFGIIGLAIAFIIGAAASAVVNALVKDLINPLVGIFLPSGNLSSLNATVTSRIHHHRDSRLLPVQTAQASGLRKDLVFNSPRSLPWRIVELYSSKNVLYSYCRYEKRHYSGYDRSSGPAQHAVDSVGLP